MLKRMLWLLLFAGAVFAQDDEEDDGIEIDSTPESEEPEDSTEPAKKPTRKRGKRPGTVLFTARIFEIELPEAWEPKLLDAAKSELAWDVKLPGSNATARLYLNREDKMADPRSAPRQFREGALKNFKGKEAESRGEPVPQLIVHFGEPDRERVAQYVFRKIKGNPYYLLLDCGKAAFAAGAVQNFFFLLKYGDTRPQWAWSGEYLVARVEQMTGKPLPNMHAGFANWIGETKVGGLDDLAEITEENKKDYGKLAFYYACMFHAGKYKKDYKKFLKEYGETYDGKAAFEKHLEPIGYDALRAATEVFMYTKIKSLQPKK
ncbi:MAG: hypothetical protein ACYTDU_12110 [Planctomycetota bacterium]|jgi:hypothetical protein